MALGKIPFFVLNLVCLIISAATFSFVESSNRKPLVSVSSCGATSSGFKRFYNTKTQFGKLKGTFKMVTCTIFRPIISLSDGINKFKSASNLTPI